VADIAGEERRMTSSRQVSGIILKYGVALEAAFLERRKL
jgi:hypothetical protein